MTARGPRSAWSPRTRVSLPCNRSASSALSAAPAGVATRRIGQFGAAGDSAPRRRLPRNRQSGARPDRRARRAYDLRITICSAIYHSNTASGWKVIVSVHDYRYIQQIKGENIQNAIVRMLPIDSQMSYWCHKGCSRFELSHIRICLH